MRKYQCRKGLKGAAVCTREIDYKYPLFTRLKSTRNDSYINYTWKKFYLLLHDIFYQVRILVSYLSRFTYDFQ